ncbi:MAG: EFR1 family ferrodoxin [Anaerovoracaceae bacterium]|jgi:ferredoxin
MIFWFSGTGNSKYAAEKLAEDTNDRLVSIAEEMKDAGTAIRFEVAEDEPVGFVFPVYFGGLPLIVRKFLKLLELDIKDQPYIYALVTCGSDSGKSKEHFRKALLARDLSLTAFYSVVMPANYVAVYEPPDKAKAEKILAKADGQIELAEAHIEDRDAGTMDENPASLLAFPEGVGRRLYNIMRVTKKFTVEDSCVSCGLCARVCPDGTIKIGDTGKPEWVKSKCDHCMACISRCPENAIQFGDKTSGRRRYVNPNVDL